MTIVRRVLETLTRLGRQCYSRVVPHREVDTRHEIIIRIDPRVLDVVERLINVLDDRRGLRALTARLRAATERNEVLKTRLSAAKNPQE